MQWHSTFMYMVIFAAIVSIHIGFCAYINAFVEDFRNIIGQLKVIEMFPLQNSKRSGIESRLPIDIRKTMIEGIQLHIEMLR